MVSFRNYHRGMFIRGIIRGIGLAIKLNWKTVDRFDFRVVIWNQEKFNCWVDSVLEILKFVSVPISLKQRNLTVKIKRTFELRELSTGVVRVGTGLKFRCSVAERYTREAFIYMLL